MTTVSTLASQSVEDSNRSCWVCFGNDDDDPTATWSRPCCCRGTTKWVHHTCLQRWIDEKQKGSSATKVACPQCNYEYVMVFPPQGPFLYALDVMDRVIYKVCPFLAGGIVLGSLYWSAVTYGAVTVMQVMGHKEGLASMEQADPLFLLIGLPTIPVMLVLGKMCRWEEHLLRFWRRHSPKIPLLHYLLPSTHHGDAPTREVGGQDALFSNPLSATRVLCGALILPTVATFCGKMMYSNMHSNLQRTLLGGMTFVAIKGVLKVYYKHQQYIRQSLRSILDFDEKAEQQRRDEQRLRDERSSAEASSRARHLFGQSSAEAVGTGQSDDRPEEAKSQYSDDDDDETDSNHDVVDDYSDDTDDGTPAEEQSPLEV